MSILTWKREKELEQGRPISFEEKHENFIAAVKMGGSQTKVNRNRYNISSTERVTRKFLEVSLCSHAK